MTVFEKIYCLSVLIYIFVDGRIILKRIFRKTDEEAWSGFLWLGIRTVCGRL
jgi:hypothetical protein